MKYELAYSTYTKADLNEVKKLIDTEMFSMGKHVAQFEKEFAKYFGMKHAIMVNSGSSANLIATAALFHKKKLPLKAGDEVIVPNISWSTTFYPLHQYGLKLKFVDVDLDTLNMDVDELAKAISPKTKMVLPVGILGNPCEMHKIKDLCEKNNLILFEDNCESMGAKIEGKYTGTFGLVNTFSTFFSHHISTMEGGLILTDDFEIYCLCRSLRNHGWTRDQPENSPLYTKKEDDFYEAYRFILPGYNVRPTELQGLLGSLQIKRLDGFIAERRKNAKYFKEKFSDEPRFILQKENGESSWFSFVMVLKSEFLHLKNQVFHALRDADIGFRIVTGGDILQHDVAGFFDKEVTKDENAIYIHKHGFFVGNAPFDLTKEIDYLHLTLSKVK